MIEWRNTTWGDVITLQRGYDITKKEQDLGGDIPVVSSGGISSYHDRAIDGGPGVIIGRKGTLGRVHFVEGPFWPHDTTLWVCDFKGNDPRFVFYALRAIDPTFLNVGSASPTLNRNHVHPLPVSWPATLNGQRAIAEVLSALDDKIAANSTASAISRDLACTTFDRAVFRRGGRVRVRDVAQLVTRGVAPKYVVADGVTVINQKCVRDRQISLAPSRMTTESSVRTDKLLRRDDVLVNSTGAGTLGRVARWTQGVRATVDSHVTIVRFDRSLIDPVCAGFGLLRVEKEIEGLAEGSTGQTELRRDLLAGIEIDVPDAVLQGTVGAELSALDELSLGLRRESDILAATRDELLPLLMSGKIRVREAEEIVEGVV